VIDTIFRFNAINENFISNQTHLTQVKEFKVRFKQEIESRSTPCDESIAKSPAILSSILNPQFKEGSHLDKENEKTSF
jgi:hypothetical protein